MVSGTGYIDDAGGKATECAESDGGSWVKGVGNEADNRRADWSAADKGGGP